MLVAEGTVAAEADPAAPSPAVGLLDAIPSAAVTLDADGRIVLVNRAWREFAVDNGASPDDVSAGVDYLAACGGDAGRIVMGINDVLTGRLPAFTAEYPCHSPREERWFRVSATPYGDGALVIHSDITDQYVRLNRWLSRTDVAIIELRPDLSLSFMNDSWRRVAGLDEWTSPIHPVDVTLLNEHLAQCWLDRKPFALDARVGSSRYRMAAHVELSTDGEVAGIVLVGIDVADHTAAVTSTR